MTKPTTLSTTANALLTAATARDDRLALPPERLPAAAQRAVVQSLLKAGLLEEIAADDNQAAWRTTDGGERLSLRITNAGLHVVGGEPADGGSQALQSSQNRPTPAAPPAPPPEAAPEAPVAATQADTRLLLRAAAQAVVEAWEQDGRPALPGAVAALSAALAKAPAGRPARAASSAPRAPRTHTKQSTVIALLRRAEGATIAQIAETTGWQTHTVRGFFAGLKKRQGLAVEAVDRVRQVGPGKEGAKGSYTVYRVAEPG